MVETPMVESKAWKFGVVPKWNHFFVAQIGGREMGWLAPPLGFEQFKHGKKPMG